MPNPSQPAAAVEVERKSLRYSIYANVLIAVVGTSMALWTDSEAILLDGLFNLVYVFVGIFTLKVAGLLQLGDDAQFPVGYAFFEPLVNGIKGMLVLGISILAFISSVDALFSGGRPISAGAAMLYGVFASALGWTMAVIIRRGAKQTKSPLLRVDAENWLINGAISSAVLLAFAATWFLGRTSYAHLAPYADPLVVVLIVIISISVPVRMAWQALMEMLNRAPSQAIVDEVTREVSEELSDLPVRDLFVRVLQPGRTRMIWVHVILPEEYSIASLGQIDAIRERTHARLSKIHAPVELDLVLTADERWAAPRGVSPAS